MIKCLCGVILKLFFLQ